MSDVSDPWVQDPPSILEREGVLDQLQAEPVAHAAAAGGIGCNIEISRNAIEIAADEEVPLGGQGWQEAVHVEMLMQKAILSTC